MSERGVLQRLLDSCLLLLGGAIALSVAVHLIEPIWPWIIGGTVVLSGLSLAHLLWRRGSRW